MTNEERTAEKDVTQSVQTRCPRMKDHVYRADPVPMPCPDCYSVRVTCERLPAWEPEVRWHSVFPPEVSSTESERP